MKGHNVKIDVRWSGANLGDDRKDIADLVSAAPDVILATGSPTLGPLLQATRTVPIVFASVADPVGSGLSQAWPGLVAMRRDFPFSITASPRSGPSC